MLMTQFIDFATINCAYMSYDMIYDMIYPMILYFEMTMAPKMSTMAA